MAFRRDLTPVNAFGITFTTVGVLLVFSSDPLHHAFVNGGPVVMVWGWVAASALNIVTALCLAEMAACMPAAVGSLYFFTARLAPWHSKAFATWVAAWANLGAALGTTAYYALATTRCIASAVRLAQITKSGVPYDSADQYGLTLGQQFGVYCAVLLSWMGLMSAPLVMMAWVITGTSLWQVFGGGALFGSLVAVAPVKQSGAWVLSGWCIVPRISGIRNVPYNILVGLMFPISAQTGYENVLYFVEELLVHRRRRHRPRPGPPHAVPTPKPQHPQNPQSPQGPHPSQHPTSHQPHQQHPEQYQLQKQHPSPSPLPATGRSHAAPAAAAVGGGGGGGGSDAFARTSVSTSAFNAIRLSHHYYYSRSSAGHSPPLGAGSAPDGSASGYLPPIGGCGPGGPETTRRRSCSRVSPAGPVTEAVQADVSPYGYDESLGAGGPVGQLGGVGAARAAGGGAGVGSVAVFGAAEGHVTANVSTVPEMLQSPLRQGPQQQPRGSWATGYYRQQQQQQQQHLQMLHGGGGAGAGCGWRSQSVLPESMYGGLAASCILALLYILLMLVAVPSMAHAVDPYNETLGQDPMSQVIYDILKAAYGSGSGSPGLISIIAIGLYGSGLVCTAGTARKLWAMATDGFVPQWLCHISARTGVPVRASVTVTAISMTPGLLLFVDDWAAAAVLSFVLVAINASYLLPVALRLLPSSAAGYEVTTRRVAMAGGFTLGRGSRPLFWVASVWLVVSILLAMLPSAWPLRAATANWAAVASAALAAVVLGSWYLPRWGARRWFRGLASVGGVSYC